MRDGIGRRAGRAGARGVAWAAAVSLALLPGSTSARRLAFRPVPTGPSTVRILRFLGLKPLPGPRAGPDAGWLRAARAVSLLGGLVVTGRWQTQPLTWQWLATTDAHALGLMSPGQPVDASALRIEKADGLVPASLRFAGLIRTVSSAWDARSLAVLARMLGEARPASVRLVPQHPVTGPNAPDPLILNVANLAGETIPARDRLGETLRIRVRSLHGTKGADPPAVGMSGFFLAPRPGIYAVQATLEGGRVARPIRSRPAVIRVYGPTARIVVSPTKPQIVADGYDEALVTVTAEDRFGTPVLDAEGEASLDPKGGLVVTDPATGTSTTAAVTLPLSGGQAVFAIGPASLVGRTAAQPATLTAGVTANVAVAGRSQPPASRQSTTTSGGTGATGSAAAGGASTVVSTPASPGPGSALSVDRNLAVTLVAPRPSRVVLSPGLPYVPESPSGTDAPIPLLVNILDQAGYPDDAVSVPVDLTLQGPAEFTPGGGTTANVTVGAQPAELSLRLTGAGVPGTGQRIKIHAATQGLPTVVLDLPVRVVGRARAIRPTETALSVPIGAVCASRPDAAAADVLVSVVDRKGDPVPYTGSLSTTVVGPKGSTGPAALVATLGSDGARGVLGWQLALFLRPGSSTVIPGVYTVTIRGPGLIRATVAVAVIASAAAASTCGSSQTSS